jgi:ABC-type transporter Mla subunit MlaD
MAEEKGMGFSMFRWPPRPKGPQENALSESRHPAAREEVDRRSVMFAWSSSPALQKIYQDLEEQQRIIEQLKRYLEERLTPFQRHVNEQRRNVDQALKHLESRLKPLRQYIQGEEQNLERVLAHLQAGLRDQFEAFEQYLASQRALLEKASQYIEEQPRPLQTYLEDQRRSVELIYRDLEQRLDRFMQNLWEQQKILESLNEPQALSEYEILAEYLEERRKAMERFCRSAEYRPAELFAQLEEIADRYKRLDLSQHKVFARVFEEARLADERLREALPLPRASSPAGPRVEDQE